MREHLSGPVPDQDQYLISTQDQKGRDRTQEWAEGLASQGRPQRRQREP